MNISTKGNLENNLKTRDRINYIMSKSKSKSENNFKTGDIIIFREKNSIQSLYSAITFNLDNHIGIILKKNNKYYLNHFVITSFKNLLINILFNFDYDCGEARLTSVENLEEKEYYHYKNDQDKIYDEKLIDKIIEDSKKFNYVSKIGFIINQITNYKIFNISSIDDHSCYSYLLWVASKLDLYNINYLKEDYYKFYSGVQDNILKNKGSKCNYKIERSHNAGIKNLKNLKNFNPYALSYIIGFIHNIFVGVTVELNTKDNRRLNKFLILILVIIYTLFGLMGADFYTKRMIEIEKKGIGSNGMRFIGAIIPITGLTIIVEKLLNLEINYWINFIFYLATPRIFLTRYASWLCNDLTGKINEKTLRPFDSAFYEAIYEGLIPFIFIISTKNYLIVQNQNMIITLIYTISRIIIEFKKSLFTEKSNITLGQIDSIVFITLMNWIVNSNENFITKTKQFGLFLLFFEDINQRFSLKLLDHSTKITENLKLKWKKTYNKGFFGGSNKNMSKTEKLLYPLANLILVNRFLLYDNNYLYFFNAFALLNILERVINGHVTDYITIEFFKYKTYNFNYADVMINLFMIYGLIYQILLYLPILF